MSKLAISASAITLLCVSALAQADGHADAEATIEKLEQQKKVLATRLENAIAYSTQRDSLTDSLQAQLESAKNKSKFLGTRLNNAIAYSTQRDALTDSLQAQLASAKNKSKFLGTRLNNAIAYSTQRDALTDSLQSQLASAKNKSQFLGTRLNNAIAYSNEREAQIASAESEKSDWAAQVSANLDSAIGGVEGTTVVAYSDHSVNVQVGNNGLFSTGGVALSAEGSRLLSTVAQLLAGQDSNITVVGHTDNVPVGNSSRFSSNEELSFARAVSTLQFLRDQGIPSERLSATGFGAGSPIAGNDTAEGRAQNRRVEIILRQQ